MRSVTLLSVLALAVAAAVSAQEAMDWPREFATAAGTVVVYQPQPETLEGDVMTGRAAVCVTRHADSEPRFGAVWFEALLDIDREERIVHFDSLQVTRLEFADGSLDPARQLARGIEAAAPDLSMSLDQLLASLEEGADGQESRRFRHAAPRIVVAQEPTVLVVLDGPEQRRDLGAGIEQVVNTPYVILFDRADAAYYLTDGRTWFRTKDLEAPWQHDAHPSRTLVQLAAKVDARRDPGEDDDVAFDRAYRIPRIVVSSEPAELIVFEGQPRYAALQGGQLLYATNTESEVLIDIAAGRHYVLLAGRWYRSRTLAGPWTFVEPEDLPQSFRDIPTDSEKAALRAHVHGTEEAHEAVLDAQIPETAAIRRNDARLTVEYDGVPRFEPVSGVRVTYAVNSPFAVLNVGRDYYACHNAMWFVAADPYGPWVLAETVPREIYLLPPSCPVYHVRYAYIYRVTPEVIYVGYVPGYLGSYVYHGTVIYGSGWVYRPWVGTAFYVPRPYTWGLHAQYTAWTSGWSFGYSTDIGFWDFSISWGTVHPWWPTTAYGYQHVHEYGGWWGPGGYRHQPPRHRPHERDVGRPQRERSATDVYRRPDVAALARPGTTRQRARSSHPTPTARPAQAHTTPRAPTQRANDVVVDRDGNVFRRDDTGWKQRLSTGWTSGTERPRAVQTPSAPTTQRPADRATPRSQTDAARGASPVPPAPATPPASATTATGFRPWATPLTRQSTPAPRPEAAPTRPRTPPPKLQGPRGARELQQSIEGRERGANKKEPVQRPPQD